MNLGNKFSVLASLEEEDSVKKLIHDGYEVNFPALSGEKTRVLKYHKSPISPLSQVMGLKFFTEEEEDRYEVWAIKALSKAREGRSPISKEEIGLVIDWLAYNRGFRAEEISDWLNSPPEVEKENDAVLLQTRVPIAPFVLMEVVTTKDEQVKLENPPENKVEIDGKLGNEESVASKSAKKVDSGVKESAQGSLKESRPVSSGIDEEGHFDDTKAKEVSTAMVNQENKGVMSEEGSEEEPELEVDPKSSVRSFPVCDKFDSSRESLIVGDCSENVDSASMDVLDNKDKPTEHFDGDFTHAHRVFDEIPEAKRSYNGDADGNNSEIKRFEEATECSKEGVEVWAKPNPVEDKGHFGRQSWANIVGNRGSRGKFTNQSKPLGLDSICSRSGMDLEFFESSGNDYGIIDIEDNMVDEDPWLCCIVGYFFGPDMPFGLIRATARTIWGRFGLLDVYGNNNGFYFLKFQKSEDMECVLDNGPWLFSGRPIFIRKWKKCLSLTKEAHKKIPVWVKIHDLPLEFWNSYCLSKITSALGVPLYVDKATKDKSRISYAWVCVEIEAIKSLKESVQIRCGGEHVEVRVEYQGIPLVCQSCKVFGHNCSENASINSKEEINVNNGTNRDIGGTDSDSSVSTGWIRVGKRNSRQEKGEAAKRKCPRDDVKFHDRDKTLDGKVNNGKHTWSVDRKRSPRTSRRSEQPFGIIKDELLINAMKTNVQPDALRGVRVPRHGIKMSSTQDPVIVQPAVLPCHSARFAELVCSSSLLLSPASQASLLTQAIDGAGKLGS